LKDLRVASVDAVRGYWLPTPPIDIGTRKRIVYKCLNIRLVELLPVKKILVAVDGSNHVERVLDCVIDLVRGHAPLEIILLNAQPKPEEWQTHGMAKEGIEQHLHELGQRALLPAGDKLKRAAIAFEQRVELGEPAETIVRVAGEEGCDMIIMGTRGLGSLAGLLLGSVANKVLHLTSVPLTLVK
jgi:nucleotide-binding universal stress UspA family protein